MSHTPDQAAMAPEHGTLVSPKMTAGKIGSYYRQYYGNGRSLPTIIDVPNTNLIDYLANDGTTFRYNANPDQPRTTKAPTLDIKQLNNQFYDEKSGISVDYLRDYNTGDDIIFEDIIDKIQFNPNEKQYITLY